MRLSQFEIKKALLDHLRANSGGLTVVTEGGTTQISPDGEYVAEHVAAGVSSTTASALGRDTLQTFYQLDVMTPKVKGDFYCLKKCDLIKDAFGKGVSAGIEYNGQKISITRIDISGMDTNEAGTHIVHYLSVYFTAF